MRPAAVQLILDEHLAIASVLYSLRSCVRRMRTGAKPPDFSLLHALLDYIVEYPDRWHHPKESRYLFAALRAKEPKAARIIDELEREHRDGDGLIVDLQRELAAFERGDARTMQRFASIVEAYVTLQWEHMRREEDVLLPMAERVLELDDWQRIAQAFRENDNPLFGIKPRDDAERLYRKIVALAAR